MRKPELKKIAGIDCIFIPLQETNSITTEIFFKAGSNYEHKDENGISHFLEHLAFKGGETRKTPKEVRDQLEKIGASHNAITTINHTRYFIKSLYSYAELQLEILADMIVHATYNEEEIKKERDVIIQEIKKRKDNIKIATYDKAKLFLLGNNSYGRNVIGSEENILKITRDDIIRYKESLYTKDNMLIVIAGKIENQIILEKAVEKLFSSLSENKKREILPFKWSLPKDHEEYREKDSEQALIYIGIPWIPISDKEMYAGSILTKMLSSQLFQRIRTDLGLCYSINVNQVNQKDYGTLFIDTGLNKDKLEIGKQEINKVLDEFITGDLIKSFQNAKEWQKANILTRYETSNLLTTFYGISYLIGNRLKTPEDIAQIYDSIQLEDIQSLLPFLKEDKRYTFYIK